MEDQVKRGILVTHWKKGWGQPGFGRGGGCFLIGDLHNL
jgi:hypothetical protein